jgi:hypothetical protein
VAGEVKVKECNRCFEVKELVEFHINRKGKYGRQPTCKKCLNAKALEKWVMGEKYKPEYEETDHSGLRGSMNMSDYNQVSRSDGLGMVAKKNKQLPNESKDPGADFLKSLEWNL